MTDEVKPGGAEITYVGRHEGIDVYELNERVVRNVPFRAPIEYCARQIALRPAEWECSDPAVIEAAKPLIEEEARKLAEFEASTRPAPPAPE